MSLVAVVVSVVLLVGLALVIAARSGLLERLGSAAPDAGVRPAPESDAQQPGPGHGARRAEGTAGLAGDIAHDLNNLLLGIAGIADIALDDVPEGSPLRRHLEEIGAAAERSGELARRLLLLARSRSAEPRPIGLDELVSGLEGALRALLGDSIALRLELTNPGAVCVNPDELEHALVELALEARRVLSPNGREIVVATTVVEYPGGNGSLAPGRYAATTLRDAAADWLPRAAQQLVPFALVPEGGDDEALRPAFAPHFAAQAGGTLLRGSAPSRGPLAELLLPLHTG